MTSLAQALTNFERLPRFQQWYRWYVTKIPQMKIIFPWIWAAFLVFGSAGMFVYMFEPRTYIEVWFESGRKFGQLAVIFYLLSLVPGMLKRYQILPITRAGFMLLRRELGISMFIIAFVHQTLVRIYPIIIEGGGVFFPAPGYVYWGIASLALLFPLWLTSNDYSVRKMGQSWHTIHAFTYVALLTIFLHVALVGNRTMAIFMGLGILAELGSWIIYWTRPKKV